MITHGFTRPSGKKVSGEELVKICTEYIAKDPMAEYESGARSGHTLLHSGDNQRFQSLTAIVQRC